MSNDHLVLCGTTTPASRKNEWLDAKRHCLEIGPGKNQIRLEIRHATSGMVSNLTEAAIDLIGIAAYVYAADQAASRGGRKRVDYGAAWRRRFRFKIPVRQLDQWRLTLFSVELCPRLDFEMASHWMDDS